MFLNNSELWNYEVSIIPSPILSGTPVATMSDIYVFTYSSQHAYGAVSQTQDRNKPFL